MDKVKYWLDGIFFTEKQNIMSFYDVKNTELQTKKVSNVIFKTLAYFARTPGVITFHNI